MLDLGLITEVQVNLSVQTIRVLMAYVFHSLDSQAPLRSQFEFQFCHLAFSWSPAFLNNLSTAALVRHRNRQLWDDGECEYWSLPQFLMQRSWNLCNFLSNQSSFYFNSLWPQFLIESSSVSWNFLGNSNVFFVLMRWLLVEALVTRKTRSRSGWNFQPHLLFSRKGKRAGNGTNDWSLPMRWSLLKNSHSVGCRQLLGWWTRGGGSQREARRLWAPFTLFPCISSISMFIWVFYRILS